MTVADSNVAVAPGDALPAPWRDAPFLQRCAGLAEPSRPSLDADLADWQAYFRRARRFHTARIAQANLTGHDDAWATLEALSATADRLLAEAADVAAHMTRAKHGAFAAAGGATIGLGIVAMGKLGGQELNFSSDVDLVFVYAKPADDASDGARPLDPGRYFAKQAQTLIALLEPPTADGFAYRVDARLRPFGTAGPLAVSGAAWVAYYESHGRTWERYALIKARAVVDPNGAIAGALDQLNPFVYRRHLDFTAIESLRGIHAEIAADVRRNGAEDDLKRGRGGIREAEFVVQALQLIWGGQDPDLRGEQWRTALHALQSQDRLPTDAAEELEAAYVLLRQLENRVQMWDDRQTHSLPQEAQHQVALASAFGLTDYAALQAELARHRAAVWQYFVEVVGDSQGDGEASAVLLTKPRGEQAADLLRLAGLDAESIEAAQQAAEHLAALPALQAAGRTNLQRLWPKLLRHEHVRDADTVRRLHDVLDAIAGRTTYLALLDERPVAAAHLARLVSASPAIAKQIVNAPSLLDELLDPRVLYAPPGKADLQADLQEALENAEHEEGRLDALSRFRNQQTLRVAAAELTGALPLMRVSDHLSWIAECVVEAALQLAGADIRERHGDLPGQPQLSVIAYGKLGGLELNYGSDLDLVFLHDADADCSSNGRRPLASEPYMIRWAQRLIHWLTTRCREGRCYEVDTRLRPSGNAGLMVTRIAAFDSYQHKRAWTWEHQALVRARCVAGPEDLAAQFNAIRREVLEQPREPAALRTDICDMRERLRKEWGKHVAGQFDLKHGPGGIMDLEFLVQYLVLAHASSASGLSEWSDNVRQLQALASAGVLEDAEAEALTQAYLAYRSRMHELTLLEQALLVDDGAFVAHRDAVVALWAEHLQPA